MEYSYSFVRYQARYEVRTLRDDTDVWKVIEFINRAGADLLESGALRVPDFKSMTRLLDDRWTIVLSIYDVEENIVGTLMLCLRQTWRRRIGTIEYVLIDPASRGRSLGRALMTAVIDLAEKQGIARLELTSEPGRITARSLYVSLGFRLVEGSDRHFRLDL